MLFVCSLLQQYKYLQGIEPLSDFVYGAQAEILVHILDSPSTQKQVSLYLSCLKDRLKSP